VAAGTGAFYPPVLPYRDGAPIPPGYRLESDANTGLILGGVFTTLIGYGAALAVGAANDFENGTGWLAVPVIGPWGALGSRSNPCADIEIENATLEDAECVEAAVDEARLVAFMTLDGLVQMVGATLLIVGAATSHEELVRTDIAGWTVTPRVGTQGVTIGAHTRF
jgi:hypothetical protein